MKRIYTRLLITNDGPPLREVTVSVDRNGRVMELTSDREEDFIDRAVNPKLNSRLGCQSLLLDGDGVVEARSLARWSWIWAKRVLTRCVTVGRSRRTVSQRVKNRLSVSGNRGCRRSMWARMCSWAWVLRLDAGAAVGWI